MLDGQGLGGGGASLDPALLALLATAAGDDSEGDDDAAPSGKRARRGGKAPSAAAVVKADRQRAQRERLTDYFDELWRLCDTPGGARDRCTSTRADRCISMADAIRVIGQLRVENNLLKQQNKFMEKRYRALEGLGGAGAPSPALPGASSGALPAVRPAAWLLLKA